MPRSQNKVASHRRRKKLLAQAKGYWGGRSKVHTIAKHHVEKAGTHAYRHRRTKKREIRGLWITRINAGARLHGVSYSKLVAGLAKKKVELNRKVLADLAVNHPQAFAEVVKFATA
ncbi:MAG: 50S ribosomal protein L20 [Ignavibacteria bacterium GWA2_55_11]|nr:MAG: 50S ribosomal protein L20 [Ignavibacteria bacterium GWA2_55_11]OGU44056.1 MAG: 50S ribosomal protein L20 [Ignavibacteria bacterium GWC2_56_12]OGU68357.1 MAG: 50S ribosomal protein L20 [Ignavibacteria bacterium RIFCSPHIGHO2_02_FULL_56_12]OGU71303.1 MAG: 50S ribosomal protein L20 [Ignavibacteria bacterium RIFCSPLOWO2_12_FULL_56_21]OGU75596.1 MAG: 50S ribosomal protein L20 [Ignavibacteria bacterium RIFCSPLOWO2_02_FULL_55_14]